MPGALCGASTTQYHIRYEIPLTRRLSRVFFRTGLKHQRRSLVERLTSLMV